MTVEHDLVLVVDFDSHYAELVARRVREAGVRPEIVPHTLSAAQLLARKPQAIILSGGPQSVYSPSAPELDPGIFDGGVPIFGICFGFQAMTVALGGEVCRSGGWEFGPADVTVTEPGTLLTAVPVGHRVWMSHADSVEAAPDGMTVLATTVGASVAAFESQERRIAGVQWHPEDLHTEHGQQVLERFLVDIAGCRRTWPPITIGEDQFGAVREKRHDKLTMATRFLLDRFTPASRSPADGPLWPRRTRWRRWRWPVAAAVATILAVTAVLALGSGDGGWVDGQRYGDWLAVYFGYGRTSSTFDSGVQTITLAPHPPEAADVTHAGLVVSVAQYGDLDVRAMVKTEAQLRPQPNPWEVAWLLVRYSDPDHFYSLALKPNGWELSKQDPAYPGKQRFLATGNSPKFPVGLWRNIRIIARGNTIEASVDGVELTQFTDVERPYLQGSVGLYTEDARSLFRAVQVTSP